MSRRTCNPPTSTFVNPTKFSSAQPATVPYAPEYDKAVRMILDVMRNQQVFLLTHPEAWRVARGLLVALAAGGDLNAQDVLNQNFSGSKKAKKYIDTV